MNCNEALELMHGFVDGELDLVKNIEIERHLDTCPSCKVQYDSACELASAIRAHAAYYVAPPDLRARIVATLPRQPVSHWRSAAWNWGGMAAALVVSTLLGLVLLQPGSEDRLVQEVVAAHVRSLMADHLTDIASSDQHAVKPWIAGKLDFSPPVKDLTAKGYVLAGGRLDYLGGRGVMALVYRRHGHVINLFVWPNTTDADSQIRTDLRQGYNAAQFTRAGMTYWAVSDLNQDEFNAFVGLVREQVARAG